MPAKPPTFRPAGWKPREPWSRPAGWRDKRKRGRAGQRDRAQVLLEEPYCRECLKAGRRRQARIVDHIVPLEWSECDERYNKQALCIACHDEKSKQERVAGRPNDEKLAATLRRLKAEWLSSTS